MQPSASIMPRAAAITEGAKPREVLVAGKRCRMVGRISMDLLALDVTDLPVSAVRRDQARNRDAVPRRHRIAGDAGLFDRRHRR